MFLFSATRRLQEDLVAVKDSEAVSICIHAYLHTLHYSYIKFAWCGENLDGFDGLLIYQIFLPIFYLVLVSPMKPTINS